MNSNLDLQKISPQMCGIIWIEQQELSFNSNCFTQMNYLLDNLLVLEQKKQKDIQSKTSDLLHHHYSLFWSTSFSHPFIVIHINLENIDLKSEKYQHLDYVLTEFIQTINKVYPQFSLNEIGYISSDHHLQKAALNQIKLICQKHHLKFINCSQLTDDQQN